MFGSKRRQTVSDLNDKSFIHDKYPFFYFTMKKKESHLYRWVPGLSSCGSVHNGGLFHLKIIFQGMLLCVHSHCQQKKELDKCRLFKSTKKSADSPGRKSAKYLLENCRLHAVVFVELLKCHNTILFALPLDNFKIIVF